MQDDRGEIGKKCTVHVLVVDDQQLIREGIASLLGIQDGVHVVGTAANGQEAVEKALALSPDVVLMDVRMPVMDGVQATARICGKLEACQVLMLTTFDDEEYIVKALHAGARGYLLKDIPPFDLARAIQLAHAGIYQLDPAVGGKLIGTLSRTERIVAHGRAELNATASSPSPLTDREVEVLRLIASGATNREIAAQLTVSEGTIKNHISNILNRLDLRDRTQAALYARDHHLI
ncbi:DNA-binding response regulator [Reticulibacter mediterranei]|uniref:DNA-binding response regulator n=1 Tax=Reticulibacter mediterranei TaxID=2778369 RepID=A0A8J3I8R5_9CHLR|nr:response regulator transcription factor [Reticulibacter mediterranei]GHO90944.1 DNA-binding response regulator [Reticulibacter mediterranei]